MILYLETNESEIIVRYYGYGSPHNDKSLYTVTSVFYLTTPLRDKPSTSASCSVNEVAKNAESHSERQQMQRLRRNA